MKSSPSYRITPWVGRLIIANAVVLLLLMTVFTSPALQQALWFAPGQALQRPWTFVTYMFVHAPSPSHILFNMLILWMFGVELERVWRTPFFVKYYFVTGVGAGLLSIAVSLLPFAATRATYFGNIIGASGALYGLLLAYAVYYPNRPILMFLFFPVPAKYFVAILGAVAFIMSLEGGGTVAATTHLGGLLIGYLYLQSGRGGMTAEIKYRYLRWRMNRMRRRFDVYAGGRSGKSSWDRHVH